MIGLALWILSFLRRRDAIGGWLLVFFIQIFVREAQLVIGIVAALVGWNASDRSFPSDVRALYLPLSLVIAILVANTWIVIAAIRLLRYRRWRQISDVRVGLAALAILAIVRIIYANTAANWLDALFPTVFLPYFFLSKRVRRVFQTHDWSDSSTTSLHLTRSAR